MPRKYIIFSIIGLLLIAGGVFWWWQGREIKGSSEEYEIKETPEGTIVENKKARLVVKVPEGWEVKKMEIEEGLMVFYSPDIKGEIQNNKIVPPLEKGCIIHVSVRYEAINFTDLKLQAKYNLALLGAESEEFEEIIIGNYRALKTVADTQKIGPAAGIDIPYKGKTYSFLLISAPDNKDNCIQEFDKFLETVSIE